MNINQQEHIINCINGEYSLIVKKYYPDQSDGFGNSGPEFYHYFFRSFEKYKTHHFIIKET